MNELIEYRDLYHFSVLGCYDTFLEFVCCTKDGQPEKEVTDLIFEWNRIQSYKFIEKLIDEGGLEITSGRYAFVIAPNPKLTRDEYPWRITHYYEGQGALCDEEFPCAVEAIISILLSYSDASISTGVLDLWFNNNNKS